MPDNKKFLIFPKPAIGDILLATPMIRSIRRAEPEATIDVMLYHGQESILEGNTDIDNIVPVDDRPAISELWPVIRRLWRRYDVMITNAADDRVHLYLLLFARRRYSVTLQGGAAWKRWITHDSVVEGPSGIHALLRNNRLGELLGYPARYDIVTPTAGGEQNGSSVVADIVETKSPFAVLQLDARLPYKRWSVEGWREIAQSLAERGLTVVMTGGARPDERQYLEDAHAGMPDGTVLVAGELRFAHVCELLKACAVYVGVDTVCTHLAAARGAPTVALFGPESAELWGPWPKAYAEDASPWTRAGSQRVGNVKVVQGIDECPECGILQCQRRRVGDESCLRMRSIGAAAVRLGIEEMLGGAATPARRI